MWRSSHRCFWNFSWSNLQNAKWNTTDLFDCSGSNCDRQDSCASSRLPWRICSLPSTATTPAHSCQCLYSLAAKQTSPVDVRRMLAVGRAFHSACQCDWWWLHMLLAVRHYGPMTVDWWLWLMGDGITHALCHQFPWWTMLMAMQRGKADDGACASFTNLEEDFRTQTN